MKKILLVLEGCHSVVLAKGDVQDNESVVVLKGA